MQIYHIEADLGERCMTLGYATGNEAAIKRYYDDKKGYGLRISMLKVVNITDKEADERAKLIQEQKDLQVRLSRIKLLLE